MNVHYEGITCLYQVTKITQIVTVNFQESSKYARIRV